MLGRAREGCREAGCAYWSMCKPITPCYRHAFGDQYKATDIPIRGPGKLELVFHPEGGGEAQRYEVHNFDGAGDLPWQAGLHALAQSAVHAAGLSWRTQSRLLDKCMGCCRCCHGHVQHREVHPGLCQGVLRVCARTTVAPIHEVRPLAVPVSVWSISWPM